MSRLCQICGDDFSIKEIKQDGDFKGYILCNKHYLQAKRKGMFLDNLPSMRTKKRECSVCKDTYKIRQWKSKGSYEGKLLCSKHYSHLRAHGFIKDNKKSHLRSERVCEVCNKDDAIYHVDSSKMLCRRHYDQMYVYGEILDRTVRDKNEIVIHKEKGYAEIVMYKVSHEESGRAFVSIEDIPLIEGYKWHISSGYATTTYKSAEGVRKSIAMHKIITNTANEIVDHISRNTLDNRRENLEVSNKSKNAMNAGIRSNNSSGVTGVSFSKIQGNWRANINHQGKRIELGRFSEKSKAIKARLEAENYYYKDNPPQKHLFKEYGVE